MLPGMESPELEALSQDEDDVDMYDLLNDPSRPSTEAQVYEEDDVDMWDPYNDSPAPPTQPKKQSGLTLLPPKQSTRSVSRIYATQDMIARRVRRLPNAGQDNNRESVRQENRPRPPSHDKGSFAPFNCCELIFQVVRPCCGYSSKSV